MKSLMIRLDIALLCFFLFMCFQFLSNMPGTCEQISAVDIYSLTVAAARSHSFWLPKVRLKQETLLGAQFSKIWV